MPKCLVYGGKACTRIIVIITCICWTLCSGCVNCFIWFHLVLAKILRGTLKKLHSFKRITKVKLNKENLRFTWCLLTHQIFASSSFLNLIQIQFSEYCALSEVMKGLQVLTKYTAQHESTHSPCHVFSWDSAITRASLSSPEPWGQQDNSSFLVLFLRFYTFKYFSIHKVMIC